MNATYYSPGQDLWIFTCWNAQRTGCGCHSVYGPDLAANIRALEKMGYRVEARDW